MSARGEVTSFEAEVTADPDQEREQGVALAQAVAAASDLAAAYLQQNHLDAMEFEVTGITVTVAPNPGPTAYKVIITPKG
jgi:hypothetical protein